jgi:hypothetical protein
MVVRGAFGVQAPARPVFEDYIHNFNRSRLKMARPIQNPNRIITFLTNRQVAVLRKLAKKRKTTVSALVREAVEYFTKQKVD